MASTELSICETCKKEFKFYRSTLRGKTGRFCSRKCIKLIPMNKGKIEWKECLTCKTPIRKWKKYCNKKCIPNPIKHLGKYSKGIFGKDNYFYGKSFAGKDSPNWEGGITPISMKIRNSKEYILWRIAVFMRDDYTCVECKIRGKKLNADHIKPFSLYPELRFAIDNGRTLCKECHLKTETWGGRMRNYTKGELNG